MPNLAFPHGRSAPAALRGPARPLIAALCISVLTLAGCAHRKPQQSSPQALYTTAKHDLDSY
ncbi:MAG: hypothetical protein KGJ72_06575, partial [Gammaproteobacteria bacterium]|nr:hypothetical protein [Gammaproteobacteria bacterium]